MLPFLVPVDSHTASRGRVRPPEPVPEVGIVWGRSSAFSIEEPSPEADPWATDPSAGDPSAEGFRRGSGGKPENPDAEEARRRGLTIVWPQKHIYTNRTIDMSPIWRRYDIAEVTAADDPDVKIDVAVTRELLFPLRSETLKYVGGGSYVLDSGSQPYDTRVVHGYLLLELPSMYPGWTIKERGLTEGEWPDYPDEMFTPGPFV